ncbi:MAG: TraR/DksA family transcriptional regulator [Candidatus Magnetobacterium sp. LHC-1]|uniref:TraR/DksA family transcriptional regulator n=1 Tax=Candidatus Magnetobacterium casense TaxID=1455061 RepID=A0ABS6S0B8_9BACT|nr:TraR/DksA family transcriptional regulator [Candidatus Magnetobacterium casensis]MBF0608338.1 TraR/DksA family transcriptional regulator [Nitrospirota bacterium]MBV6342298.1 TraR/DksA family transcriptional regulator [Candidatus Magnetobacterium casensis]
MAINNTNSDINDDDYDRREDANAMAPTPEEVRLNGVKKVLLHERQLLLKEAKMEISNFTRGEEKQLVEAALDDGDWSVVDIAGEIILQKLHHHKIKLNKIDEALRKIKNGSYGVCEDCGVHISEARLKVLPYATMCVECKEKREKLEEIEKEHSFQ